MKENFKNTIIEHHCDSVWNNQLTWRIYYLKDIHVHCTCTCIDVNALFSITTKMFLWYIQHYLFFSLFKTLKTQIVLKNIAIWFILLNVASMLLVLEGLLFPKKMLSLELPDSVNHTHYIIYFTSQYKSYNQHQESII